MLPGHATVPGLRTARLTWSSALGWLVVAVAVGVCVLQLGRLLERPQPAVGDDVAAFTVAARAMMPPDARYLYVQPVQFGFDTGSDPRLRYDLYPRVYEDVRVADGEAQARQLVQTQNIGYVLLPHLGAYPSDSWVMQDQPWFRRVQVTPDGYVLIVQATP